MTQYYRVCYVNLTVTQEQVIAAELGYPALISGLKKYNMGKVEGYGWPVTDPIIRILIKGVFPPGTRTISEEGNYMYTTSVRLWYEEYTHGQDYVLNFLASLGVEMHIEITGSDYMYYYGYSNSSSSHIVYEDPIHVKDLG